MEQAFVNGAMLALNYALIALGITLIFGIMNILNFAHGQMFMLGGFVVYYLYARLGLNYFVALAGAAVTLMAVGAVFERLFNRVLSVATREENSMLLAVGTALLLESLALAFFGEKQRGVPPVVSGVYRVGEAFLPANRAMVMAVSLVMIVSLLAFVRHTRPGRALRAVAQDQTVTHLMGVDVDRVKMLGFALGAALAGVAGGLLVSVSGVNSGIGTEISIKAFVMILIGGAGVVSGAILGAVALGFAESFGQHFFSGSVTPLIIFGAVIVFLVLRPQGIMGKPWG